MKSMNDEILSRFCFQGTNSYKGNFPLELATGHIRTCAASHLKTSAHDGSALYTNRDENVPPPVPQQKQWARRHMHLLRGLYIVGVLDTSCHRHVGVPFPGTHWLRSQDHLLWVDNPPNEFPVLARRSTQQLHLGCPENQASSFSRHPVFFKLCQPCQKSM
ncbi:androgen-induced gene 1 protein isoform X7 [Rattus norvegicus]|uniref:androgen-induced gene 1 protein isoform X7 n=1 Tax=Rattus norvegicus TaxID=10116 RepID=UPI0019176F72|nr:androgen-induced gene 1 protein isoform X7 [Rattus norvegicus]